MNENFLRELPSWWQDTCKYDTVLSDDIDGLVSTALLSEFKDWHPKYFYDFETIYASKSIRRKKDRAERVWADVAINLPERAFDNHVTRRNRSDIFNELSINPNVMRNVTALNYSNKYSGSTALLIWSLYDRRLPSSEKGKMLLLSIDACFKGFYDKKASGEWRKANKFFLVDMFNMPELYEVQQRHDISEFYDLIANLQISTKTTIDPDGFLHTNLDLEKISEYLELDIQLPDGKFLRANTFEKRFFDMKSRTVEQLNKKMRIFSAAFTFKNRLSCSIFA